MKNAQELCEAARRAERRIVRAGVQAAAAANNPEARLSVDGVSALVGLSRASIFAKERSGAFPRAIRSGARCTRWRAGDVTAWLTQQAKAA